MSSLASSLSSYFDSHFSIKRPQNHVKKQPILNPKPRVKIMEDMDVMLSDSSSTGGATTSSSGGRWNPTKEQIVMLENLYSQGIRTPSAEQIQQITSKLRAYGHIEGKNVFYWFQNHKARQRQKQKQERMDYINRYLHNAGATAPCFGPPPPLCTNVVCGSYYIPQTESVLCPHYQKVLLPPKAGFRKKLKSRFFSVNVAGHDADRHDCDAMLCSANSSKTSSAHHHSVYDQEKAVSLSSNRNCQETLPLFPLHPTGILSSPSAAASTSSETASGFDDGQPFFDFFSGRCSG